jgi:hypothetical protein
VSTAHPGFFERLWLSFACLFRVLFDPEFAARARELTRLHPELPTPEPKATAEDSHGMAKASEPDEVSTLSASRGALQVLALLQRQGRLIDFVQQDIAGFSDADVGAAARVVHEGCRKALGSLTAISAVRGESEGSPVALEPAFDQGSIKLVGDVRGTGPYQGVLRHKGWRASTLNLPQFVGEHDPHVLAPAEVEL